MTDTVEGANAGTATADAVATPAPSVKADLKADLHDIEKTAEDLVEEVHTALTHG